LHRDADRLGSFDSFARRGSERLQSCNRLAHHPAATFGRRNQAFTQALQVLLDGKTSDHAPFSAVSVPEIRARRFAAEELVLDPDGEITNPAIDPMSPGI
jgi:hypothetical protein